mmetsp:Transcript_32553/g.48197  ORF Transcript_32553/g.48197 Transcript_32553/m.48197 type:complete len:852 (-) Transcript_32553:201-2756(-)
MSFFFELVSFVVFLGGANASSPSCSPSTTHEEEEVDVVVLFPSFIVTLGVVIFYVLSRYIKILPYTAVMFLMGTIWGVLVALVDPDIDVTNSISAWGDIDGEILLLVFLPGLIFKDAFGQNAHLFFSALSQLLIFAFPLVLAGATLTALVGSYIFPYGWSFNLAMTFGSILAATDPVAVAALLEEVGAPPRLKLHIAGESLLNDGSAIVFFVIFSERYFFDQGIPGYEEIDLAKGIALFFQMAVGGFGCGLFFGIILMVMLFFLDRRINREECIVQVCAVIAVAYLNYYVAEVSWHTSGVIATVTAGLLLKFCGRGMINDAKLLDDFLNLVEHLLNTVLFALGGVIWGSELVLATKRKMWEARDYGYLVLLYILLHVIRAVQFFAIYPITKRLGLKTNVKETSFQVFGGLRGAVGIALAIKLQVEELQADSSTDTNKAFVMIGGVAIMTLVINGTLAGPLLRKLGLVESTDTRKKILDAFRVTGRRAAIQGFVNLMTQKRFQHVNFALVRHHVPMIGDLTKEQLLDAVQLHKESTPSNEYSPPHLQHILPYLSSGPSNEGFQQIKEETTAGDPLLEDPAAYERSMQIEERKKKRKANACRRRKNSSNLRWMMKQEFTSTKELRLLFICLLQAAYENQVVDGELESEQTLTIMLQQSLEFANDAVTNGESLEDWKYLVSLHKPFANLNGALRKITGVATCLDYSKYSRANMGIKLRMDNLLIERSMAVMSAHRVAQKRFIDELGNVTGDLSEAGKIIIQESNIQLSLAEKELKNFDAKTVEVAASHKLCKVLLNFMIKYITDLTKSGMLKESECEHKLEEIEFHLDHVLSCDESKHPGEFDEISEEQNKQRL